MAKKKKKKVGIAKGPSAGGGFVSAQPGNIGIPGAVTPQNVQPMALNPYTAPAPPIDPAYEAYKVSAGRNIALADADAAYGTAQVENRYGLGSDTSNPYSQAKLLEESFRRSRRGTEIGLAQQGQLYSGAMQTAQGENKRNYSMGYDQLARSYSDAKRGITRDKLGAYAEYGVGTDQAKFDSLLRALG